ncbi:MAG: hypothetical protein SFU56_01685 [Capsulimonadales bacterium]|nr:hypothetical protein [Capsulimonadales bacterium]
MTVGDVNAVVWTIGSTGVTLWTAIVGASVLFQDRARQAAAAVENQGKKVAGVGAVMTFTAGLFALIAINQPNGLIKLIGWVLLAALMLLAILGSAGLATLTGERLCGMDRRLTRLGGVGRGAGILVAAGFLPFVGWFLLFPAMLMLSLGAGWAAIRRKAPAEAATAPVGTALSL